MFVKVCMLCSANKALCAEVLMLWCIVSMRMKDVCMSIFLLIVVM